MNEKILELKEEYERFLDTLPTLKDGENKDPITDWWIGKVTQAIAEERERVRGEIENTPIDKAHTYSSENADEYRAFDNGQESYKQKLLSSLPLTDKE